MQRQTAESPRPQEQKHNEMVSNDKPHEHAFICKSCLYSPTTNHLVRFDWYYTIVENLRRNNNDNNNYKIAEPGEDAIASEITKLCKIKANDGEPSGLFIQ